MVFFSSCFYNPPFVDWRGVEGGERAEFTLIVFLLVGPIKLPGPQCQERHPGKWNRGSR